jgi:hypothetical protein
MGGSKLHRGIAFGAALIAGGALAAPFASRANTSSGAVAAAARTAGITAATTTTTSTTSATTPVAPKPLPPVATGGYVEHVTVASAVLRATVNPEGSATEWWFQYGPTAAYGAQTPAAAAGNGTVPIKEAATITGLQPYTTYHFRVVASSPVGTTTGGDVVFTTAKIPLSLVVSGTPDPVPFGEPLTVAGTLSGTGAAGAAVVLQANPFPYLQGFLNITLAATTDSTGRFSFPLSSMAKTAQLRVVVVAAPQTMSAVTIEEVAARVTLHVRSAGRRRLMRLYGTVFPATPYAPVAIERRVHGRWVAVGGTTAKPGGAFSRFERTIRVGRHGGMYRALVEVPEGALTPGHSKPVSIR